MRYSFDNSATTFATATQIWDVWSDVNSWPTWDPHALEAKLDQPFADGSVGYLKPKGAPAGDMNFSDVVPNERWTSTAKTPFGRLVFTHTITDNGDRRVVAEHLEAKGLIAPLFRMIWAKKRIAAGQETLNALAKTAEGKNV